ncbi:carbohydrate esterase family 8 protein [Chiua virens]|nr:carbohydrate esterase family 8 protein [Chiua virens]
MKGLTLTLFYLSIFFQLALSLSPAYLACQLQKAAGESALTGCPEGTLYVSSADSTANFSSVQDAINSLPDGANGSILIGEGRYYEMINVTRSGRLTLLLDPATASVRGGNATQRNLVHIWNSKYAGNSGLTDEETATLTVFPRLGPVDFKAYNINFENLAANYSIAPALVTSITYANASFYGCAFASWQDTWYTGWAANTYAVDSIIYGQTDYIFGCGTAWFQSVTIANRDCGGGITAWRGESGGNAGVYIADSRIIRSPDALPSTVTDGKCYLARPWNDVSTAVFLRNHMDESISPTGFISWNLQLDTALPSTVYYAEYNTTGPGGITTSRSSQDHILSTDEASQFGLEHLFHGKPSWIDFTYRHHTS